MIADNLETILGRLPSGVKLVAVSKYHPMSAILEAYAEGQRAFGENRPQEFALKAVQLPGDIEWHFLGHLQTNKLKLVLPYAHIVESVDSLHLLDAINSWGGKKNKIINILLEVHIGAEQTKQGFSTDEIPSVLEHAKDYPYIRFCGLMGMASHTDDVKVVREDFMRIKALFDGCRSAFPSLDDFKCLSTGMSDDWQIAVECGSTEVRIGTSIFGNRLYL